MLAIVWICIRVLGLLVGTGALCFGFLLMDGDNRSAMRYVSCGASMVLLSLATFLPL